MSNPIHGSLAPAFEIGARLDDVLQTIPKTKTTLLGVATIVAERCREIGVSKEDWDHTFDKYDTNDLYRK